MPQIYAQSACVLSLGIDFPCGVENANTNKLMGWCSIQKKGWTTLWKQLQQKNQKEQVGRMEAG